MIERLEHEDSGALAEHHAATTGAERAARDARACIPPQLLLLPAPAGELRSGDAKGVKCPDNLR